MIKEGEQRVSEQVRHVVQMFHRRTGETYRNHEKQTDKNRINISVARSETNRNRAVLSLSVPLKGDSISPFRDFRHLSLRRVSFLLRRFVSTVTCPKRVNGHTSQSVSQSVNQSIRSVSQSINHHEEKNHNCSLLRSKKKPFGKESGK